MKKTAIFLMVFAIIGVANAVLVTNGGFDINAADWNATGGGGSGGTWGSAHVVDAGNGYITLNVNAPSPAGWAWAVWYQIGTESFNVLGIPAGTTVRFSADVREISGNGNLTDAALKIESWTTGKLDEYAQDLTVTTDWANYFIDFTPAAGATGVKCVLVNTPETGDPRAEYAFDNVAITLPGGTPALRPVPIIGGTLPAANDVISWTNPDPNNPADTITADVFILQSNTLLTKDPNLGPAILDPGVVQVANDITAESLDLSNAGYTLTAGKYYYWAVHITDPEIGLVEGFDWHFLATDDAPPTAISAGADKYVWLTMNDGTPLDGKVTFTLTGSYTDDGKSAVTTTWALNPLTQTDPATIVTIATPTALSTTVTVNNTGWFFFDFTATDAAGSGTDTVNVGVYVDACEAANADPADIPATYPNGNGDIDGDCDVDLSDFAIMAGTWLDCMSTKLDNIYCP